MMLLSLATLASLASLAAEAAPTHDQIEAASFVRVTTTKHAEAGPIEITKARVSGVDCYRGSVTVQGLSAEALHRTATDVEGAVRWSSAGVVEGRVLSRTSHRMTYYQVLDVPGWTMASDRYWFLHGWTETSEDGLVFRWDRLTGEGPHVAAREAVLAERPGAVEPPINVGGWYFERAPDGVHVAYVICSDTGGSMPRMLQNAATRRALPDTIGDVVQEARRSEG